MGVPRRKLFRGVYLGIPSDDCAPAARESVGRSLSLGVCTCALHVLAVGRLSRSPGCLQDCNIVSGRGRGERQGGGKGRGKGEVCRNYTLFPRLSPYSFPHFNARLASLLLSRYLFAFLYTYTVSVS